MCTIYSVSQDTLKGFNVYHLWNLGQCLHLRGQTCNIFSVNEGSQGEKYTKAGSLGNRLHVGHLAFTEALCPAPCGSYGA